MKEEHGYIDIGREKLHYLRMGEGKRLLIAFHGYGNEAGIFAPFKKNLEKDFTLFSIDLPHHGKSKWSDNVPLRKKDLITLVAALKNEMNVEKFSLLGYSIGGRVCLTIMALLPRLTEKVLLIAPDGLKFNPLYFFVTKTFTGRRFFKNVLTKTHKYLKIIDWLKEKKLLNSYRHQFVMHYVESESSRRFLLNVWPALSELVPTSKKLKAVIEKYKMPVYIFMGNQDRIIPPALASKFKNGLDTVRVFVLEKGHRVFDYDTAPQMAKCLI
jgi:pimeloyl-ACP methyl ester carboxylesterase